MSRTVLTSFVILCLLSTVFLMGLAFNVQPVEASGTIYIRADGSVDPLTAPIQQDGDRYSFTDNIYESIVVEKDNIVIDGAGYMLQGSGGGVGIDLTDRSNVTIKNMQIRAFEYGIWLYKPYQSSNTKILGTRIADNTFGVWIFASNNTLFRNTITDNTDSGVVIDVDSSNNIISGNNITNNDRGIWLILAFDNKFYHNNFIDNTPHVHIPMSGPTNLWNNDYPSGGNYWSDYTDKDLYSGHYQNVTGSDGIGDTPCNIDGNNRDNYPLMGRFSDFNATAEYHMQTVCNSTISHFQYAEATVFFDVTGPDGTVGFCRITIPKTLMKGPFTVYVDESAVTVSELPILNTTHAFLYFKYVHSTHTVTIVSWTERYEMLLEDFHDLLSNITDLQGNYDSLLTTISSMQEQIDSLNSTCQDLQESINDLVMTLNSTRENLLGQASLLNSTLQASLSELQERINSLNSTFQASIDALSNQLSSYSNLHAELHNIRILMYVLTATAIVLIATSVYLAIKKPKIKPQTKRKSQTKPRIR